MQGDTQSVGRRLHHQSWIIVGVALIAFAACNAPASDSVPIEVVVQEASQPTLRHLRTENIAEANEPARYVDVFELRNPTQVTLTYTVLSDGTVSGAAEVLMPDVGWTDADDGFWCRFGSRGITVKAGESSFVRTRSWLRRTRVSLWLREVVDAPWYTPNTETLSRCIATSEPFDSSLAAPGVPPVLTWGEEAAVER